MQNPMHGRPHAYARWTVGHAKLQDSGIVSVPGVGGHDRKARRTWTHGFHPSMAVPSVGFAIEVQVCFWVLAAGRLDAGRISRRAAWRAKVAGHRMRMVGSRIS